MNNSDLLRVKHIKTYCEDITKTIHRFGDDFEVFRNDTDYLNSVSMSIMQIGELSVGLSDEFKHATGERMQWGAIRGMRNLYAHAYVKMDKASIWETITMDIPGLLNFCEKTIEHAQKNQQKNIVIPSANDGQFQENR